MALTHKSGEIVIKRKESEESSFYQMMRVEEKKIVWINFWSNLVSEHYSPPNDQSDMTSFYRVSKW